MKEARTRLALQAVAGGQTDAASCPVCRAVPVEHEVIDYVTHGHVDPFREALEPLAPPHHRCRHCGSVYELVGYRHEYIVTGSGSEDIFSYRRLAPDDARARLR